MPDFRYFSASCLSVPLSDEQGISALAAGDVFSDLRSAISFFPQPLEALRAPAHAANVYPFATTKIDEDSHKTKGVFVAAYELLDSGQLTKDEWKRTREILDWFNQNLRHPPTDFDRGRAIFWFKPGARASIDRIWDLIATLREHGHHVEIFKCRRLANICNRDDFQVAAYPSDLDDRITAQ